MYICLCKSLTDRDIRRGVFRGEVACMDSLRERLGAATGCGSCEAAARRCLDEALAEERRHGDQRADGLNRHMDRDVDRGLAAGLPDLGDASPA